MAARFPVRLPRALAPLRHRGFRLLAGGQLASNLGDAFYAVALPWYVLAEHGGALLLATVLAAYGIPRTVLVAVGGHAADRWRPWTVMMAADSVRAVAVAALAGVASTGPAHAALLVPIAAVLGAGQGLFIPGSFAVVPSLLPDESLQAGNALAEGSTQLTTLVGPAIGGAVVALAGPAPAFAVDAISFVVSAVSLATIRRAQSRSVQAAAPTGVESAQPRTASSPGPAPTLRTLIASERVLQVVLLVSVAANLGSGGLSEVALPALAHGPFHTGAAGYGGMIAAFGGGALVGTLVAAQMRHARRPALMASWAYLGDAVLCGLVPFLGGPVAAGAALAAFGACNGLGNVIAITVMQRWAPPQLLGRVMGLLMLASFGIFPVSVVAGGFVVHGLGPAAFFPLAASVLAVAIAGGLTQRSWRELGSRVDAVPAQLEAGAVEAFPSGAANASVAHPSGGR